MANMNKAFDEFWYIVVPREVRDSQGEPFSQWVIVKGGTYNTVETRDNKTPAVERAKELASNHNMAGVIVGTTLGDVNNVITNPNSKLFEVAREKAQMEVGL